jgi:hypothetical protein
MAKKVITLGLSKIEVGTIANDGDIASTFEQLGYTYQDSCTMTQDDPEVNEFYAEEEDDPVAAISKGGKINFAFSLMNPSPEALVSLMGGTASKSVQTLDDNDTWEAPNSITQVEKSVRITPVQGYRIDVPRMKLNAKINAEFKKSGIFLVDVSGTVLVPTKSGVKKIKVTTAAVAS